MRKFISRVSKAYRRHGLVEFIRLLVLNIRYHTRAIFLTTEDSTEEDEFDRLYGTETKGIREIGSLDIQSINSKAAVRYQPSSERNIRNLIERVKTESDFSNCVFVDFGSGKGKVVMIAGLYPFAKVIGVEFSPELNLIAATNVAKLSEEINLAPVRLVCTDAMLFELPCSDLVCYFYNPFGEPVMSQVARRLAVHSRDLGYRVIIIYVDPQHLRAFQDTDAFKTMAETEYAVILATHDPSETRNDVSRLLLT